MNNTVFVTIALKKFDHIRLPSGIVESRFRGRIGSCALRSTKYNDVPATAKRTRLVMTRGCVQVKTFPPRLTPRIRQVTVMVRLIAPKVSKVLKACRSVLPCVLAKFGPRWGEQETRVRIA